MFDKDGTLADSRQFLVRLSHARIQRCVEASRLDLNPPPVDLFGSLLAVLGVLETGLNPDGLMAVGSRSDNGAAVVDTLVAAGFPSRSRAEALVTEHFAQADRDLRPKAPYTPPFSGTEAMLQRLHQGGLRIGVLSSDSSANVKDFLDYYHLHPWVNAWQGTDPGHPPKPAPDLLEHLCDRLGVTVACTAIVGDSWVDQALAKGAGAAGFLSVSEAWGRPPVAGATYTLQTWADLRIDP